MNNELTNNKLMNNELINNELMEPNDFIFHSNDEGVITGGGYTINSLFLQEGGRPMKTMNQNNINIKSDKNAEIKKGVFDLFDNLAVPAGLFYANPKLSKNEYDIETYKNHDMIPDDIHDKLFALIEVDKKNKRKTKKQVNKINNKKTKRNK